MTFALPDSCCPVTCSGDRAGWTLEAGTGLWVHATCGRPSRSTAPDQKCGHRWQDAENIWLDHGCYQPPGHAMRHLCSCGDWDFIDESDMLAWIREQG